MTTRILSWLGLMCLLQACPVGAAEPRPNILWITGEDMSAKWHGCYGNKQIRTPNFDKFANDGFFLGLYHAEKIRGATFKVADQIPSARSPWETPIVIG